eukprot:31198-Pelagococcus_subviridis.AAC.46
MVQTAEKHEKVLHDRARVPRARRRLARVADLLPRQQLRVVQVQGIHVVESARRACVSWGEEGEAVVSRRDRTIGRSIASSHPESLH